MDGADDGNVCGRSKQIGSHFKWSLGRRGMKKSISPTMQELIRYMTENDGKIERHPGGFWARKGWTGVSEINYGTTSVQALVSRGLADYTDWKENRGERFPIQAMLRTLPISNRNSAEGGGIWR